MTIEDGLRAELNAAMAGSDTALAAADGLCRACVGLLEVDGASISLTLDGSNRGTFGSSGEMSRRLDALQFTFGEGPCLDAVRLGRPVLVEDLDDGAQSRWPAFTGAVLQAGISAVFALPVAAATQRIGALDLYRTRSGPLDEHALTGGLLAAELAVLPLLDLLGSMQAGVSDPAAWTAGEGDGWTQLGSLERVEVYQATGMIVGALDVDPTEALVRLRAHAFAHDKTAAEVAWAIVERRLLLDGPDWRDPAHDRWTP